MKANAGNRGSVGAASTLRSCAARICAAREKFTRNIMICSHSFLPLLLVLIVTLFGCSAKTDLKAAADPSKLERAFQSADANKRAQVDKVMSAIGANDFARAILALKPLTTDSSLTSEQKTAAKNLMYEVQATFAEAADKGDTNALRAIEDLRKAQGR